MFHTRFSCLNAVKREDENFVTYAGNVNRMFERFMLLDLSIDRFKCLIFVQGLTSSKDKDIRSRILTKLEQGTEVTLQKVTEECQRMVNLKHDNTQIEEKDISHVHAIQSKTGRKMFKHQRVLDVVVVMVKVSFFSQQKLLFVWQ